LPTNPGPGSGACLPATNATDALKCSLTNNGAKVTDLVICPGDAVAPYITSGLARVCLRRQSLVAFLGLAGVTTARVSARAGAGLSSGPLPYGMMVLDPTGNAAFKIAGSATMTVTNNGGTYTRSNDSSCALNIAGSTSLTATGPNHVVGAFCGGGTVSPAPTTGYAYLNDPLSGVARPLIPGSCIGGTQHLDGAISNPTGILCYSGSVDVQNGKTATLAPGVYIFKSDLDVKGTLNSSGGVLLYFTCATSPCGTSSCNGTTPDGMSVASSGIMNLQGNSQYRNLTVFVDRTAGGGFAANLVRLTGGSQVQLNGIIYAPCSSVVWSGGSGATTLDANVLAGEISLGGTIDVSMDFSQSPPITQITYAITE
jgi:hypothetical protein